MKLPRWAQGHQGHGRSDSWRREREAEAIARGLLLLHRAAGREKPTVSQLARLVTNLMP